MPSAVSARTQSQTTCEQQRSTRVVATVGGAAAGGVLGNVVAGKGDKRLGTVIGAVGGAIVADQVAKPGRDCRDAYGYYDQEGRWHASGIGSNEARGYYDREGSWVEGPPNGRYGDDGRWVTYSGSNRGEGDYRSDGEWVPASANGYFDRNEKWVTGSKSGRYDNRGRWVTGTDTGSSSRRDAKGNWVADPQPGYYDNGRWIAGAATGYYDGRGQNNAGTGGASVIGGGYGTGRPIVTQLSDLDQYVRTARSDRRLDARTAASVRRDLMAIRGDEKKMRHDRMGNLSARDETALQARVDRVNLRLRISPN